MEPLTLKQALDLFETHLRADGRSPHTLSSYLRDLRQLERFLCEQDLPPEVSSVTAQTLDRFLTSPLATCKPDGGPKLKSSVEKLKTSVKAFFNWLDAAGLLRPSPAAGIRVRHVERPAPDILTGVEKKRLLTAISQTRGKKAFRDFAVFSLFLNTGIRVSELVRLNVDDVNLAEKKITVVVKGGHKGIRFLNAHSRRNLDSYLRRRRKTLAETDALFVSALGRRLSVRQVQRSFEGWLARAGIDKKVSVHGLRHTFATDLLERTGNLALVQQGLGHRHISTTTRYTRVASDALQEAMECL